MIVGKNCLDHFDLFSPKVYQKNDNNHFHNILRLSDFLPNFLFATIEKMRDYYLYTLHIGVASRIVKRIKT